MIRLWLIIFKKIPSMATFNGVALPYSPDKVLLDFVWSHSWWDSDCETQAIRRVHDLSRRQWKMSDMNWALSETLLLLQVAKVRNSCNLKAFICRKRKAN